MPHQNRVTPTGELIATSARGTLMGNRGRLHTPERKIVRPWQLKAWITCLLEFKNYHREIMSPNTWTELFFLDEVTAFAAATGRVRTADARISKDSRNFGWQQIQTW